MAEKEFYTDEYKYVRQYLEYEFEFCDIDKIMLLADTYTDNINILVDSDKDEWIRGDEELMNFIQRLLMIEDGDFDLLD